jgi:heme-degrading monooxygenase HmoA
MFARVTRGRFQSGSADEAAAIYRDSIVPAARQQNGFQSATLLIDRAANEFISITQWASREDIEASEQNGFYAEQVAKVRPFFAGAPERSVCEVAVSTAMTTAGSTA